MTSPVIFTKILTLNVIFISTKAQNDVICRMHLFFSKIHEILNINNKVWSYVIVNDINIELRFNGLTSFNNDTTDWES